MKKVFAMAAAIILTTGITAFAAHNDAVKTSSQKTSYQLSFAKLQVENDIDIMLVENPEKSIEFTGDDADIAKVDWKIKDGVLIIKSKEGSLKGKVKLVVNVSRLKEIAVMGESVVRSDGELNSNVLKIYIDGGSFISVRNKGVINVVNEDGTELEVRRIVGDVVFG
jgi:Putative auto-transporter adhesin, head GIN domain